MNWKYVRQYIGWKQSGGREIFLHDWLPTEFSHGKTYYAVMGPFDTWAGARLAYDTYPNPHIQSVADAEKIAADS